MKILVTGFDPFGGEKINPAIESVKRLPDEIKGNKIIKLEISTVAYKSLDQIKSAMVKENPDVVLCVGQAGGRFDITVEKIGVNLNDFRIKDNEGNQFVDTPIYEDGPAAYFSTLPVKAMVKKMQDNNVPASVSYTAGTFICNHVLYGVSYMAEHEFKNIKSGFIHIPFLTEQVVDKRNMPSMEINTLVKGLTCAIEAIIENSEDIKAIGGETH